MQLWPPLLRNTLKRWGRENYAALYQLGAGKTAERRFKGVAEGKRVQAKYLLLAAAPSLLLLSWERLGWERNISWYVWIAFSVAWFVLIFESAMVLLFRGLVRSFRWKHRR